MYILPGPAWAYVIRTGSFGGAADGAERSRATQVGGQRLANAVLDVASKLQRHISHGSVGSVTVVTSTRTTTGALETGVTPAGHGHGRGHRH
jgi:hypothetical protein